jgi:hypothetical protein
LTNKPHDQLHIWKNMKISEYRTCWFPLRYCIWSQHLISLFVFLIIFLSTMCLYIICHSQFLFNLLLWLRFHSNYFHFKIISFYSNFSRESIYQHKFQIDFFNSISLNEKNFHSFLSMKAFEQKNYSDKNMKIFND